MKQSLGIGMSFGLTSGVITTLGLIIGLNYSTYSKMAVLGGIITIAIADSLSDALGIHITQESIGKKEKSIWESTFATLTSKFLFALSFALPFLLLEMQKAVYVSVIYGILLIGGFSYHIAKTTRQKPLNVITEHIGIALIVLALTYAAGNLIGLYFS